MKKYYRFFGLPFAVAAVYGIAWIANRPAVWHDEADAVMCLVVIVCAISMAITPFEWPWEEK